MQAVKLPVGLEAHDCSEMEMSRAMMKGRNFNDVVAHVMLNISYK